MQVGIARECKREEVTIFFFNPKDADDPLLFSLSSFMALFYTSYPFISSQSVWCPVEQERLLCVFTTVVKQVA